ncbi:hypothetical protein [Brucella sp. IR073]|uniref:hypothetical protein n=1 Tax=unclassified Brucella TaxID=2632610 RepID=UPI003B9843E5
MAAPIKTIPVTMISPETGEILPAERRHDREYTLEELRQLIDESIKSGISTRSVDEIFKEAERIFAARRAAKK